MVPYIYLCTLRVSKSKMEGCCWFCYRICDLLCTILHMHMHHLKRDRKVDVRHAMYYASLLIHALHWLVKSCCTFNLPVCTSNCWIQSPPPLTAGKILMLGYVSMRTSTFKCMLPFLKLARQSKQKGVCFNQKIATCHLPKKIPKYQTNHGCLQNQNLTKTKRENISYLLPH